MKTIQITFEFYYRICAGKYLEKVRAQINYNNYLKNVLVQLFCLIVLLLVCPDRWTFSHHRILDSIGTMPCS
jgi:hypothetical protein